jgi:hypothetical protein
MSRRRPLAVLALLLFLLDRLYRVLHPVVDLERACLVGASALVALLLLSRLRPIGVRPVTGALAVFASAFGSVLLIQAGALVSQSLLSGAVHLWILAAAFSALDAAAPTAPAAQPGRRRRRPRRHPAR